MTVTVLYESLCPDSVNFLRDQFYPAYSTIKERINVELVPYGKATVSILFPLQQAEFGFVSSLGQLLRAPSCLNWLTLVTNTLREEIMSKSD